jgi:serine/threonine protein kinase
MGNICSNNRKTDETINELSLQINYNGLKVIRLIHHNNTKIYLLENNIIKKQFILPKDREQFYNEVESYRLLSHLPFILKPIHIDQKNGIIYLPYIDSNPIKNSRNKNIVNTLLGILKKEYGIWREGEYIWSNLLQNSKTQQIYLIDFGNIPWFSSVPNSKWNINRDKYPRLNLK